MSLPEHFCRLMSLPEPSLVDCHMSLPCQPCLLWTSATKCISKNPTLKLHLLLSNVEGKKMKDAGMHWAALCRRLNTNAKDEKEAEPTVEPDIKDSSEVKSSAEEPDASAKVTLTLKLVAKTKKTVAKPTQSISSSSSKKKEPEAKSVTDEDEPMKIDSDSEPGTTATNPVGRKRKATPKTSRSKSVSVKSKRLKFKLEIPQRSSLEGKVFVLGENDVGQCGFPVDEDGDECMIKIPQLLEMPFNIVDIVAGGMHSMCLTSSGEVITFGCNDEGALGRITSDESEEGSPSKIEIPEKVVQLSAGDSHSAALTEAGKVFLWGNFRNKNGPMGLTLTGEKQVKPIPILRDQTFVKIASGTDHLVCLSSGGTVYTVGCGDNGQLGRVTLRTANSIGRRGLATFLEPEVVTISPRNPVADNVWAGSYSTFIRVKSTGRIYAFGLNNHTQLGFDNTGDDDDAVCTYHPKVVPSFDKTKWSHINGGQHHTLALDSDGLVYSLGRADYGMLGLDDDTTNKNVPTIVPALQDKKSIQISCGNCVSYAITNEGSLFSWGFGTNYQLGHNNSNDVKVPRRIEGKFQSWKIRKVSGGGQHALILASPTTENSKD